MWPTFMWTWWGLTDGPNTTVDIVNQVPEGAPYIDLPAKDMAHSVYLVSLVRCYCYSLAIVYACVSYRLRRGLIRIRLRIRDVPLDVSFSDRGPPDPQADTDNNVPFEVITEGDRQLQQAWDWAVNQGQEPEPEQAN